MAWESDGSFFDALQGGRAPCADFGELVPGAEAEPGYRQRVEMARAGFEQHFAPQFAPGPAGAEALEKTVAEMWGTGWDPERNDLNLFVLHFGALLMWSLLTGLRGTPVFRSRTDLTHASVWWAEAAFEVFPFHKVAKRLSEREGDSLSFFYRATASRVGQPPQGATDGAGQPK